MNKASPAEWLALLFASFTILTILPDNGANAFVVVIQPTAAVLNSQLQTMNNPEHNNGVNSVFSQSGAQRQRQRRRLHSHGDDVFKLWAKKSKSNSSTSTSSSSTASSNQVQVKLLKHVAGTGQAGDVVLVNPAYFNNKLRPQQAAKIVSKEEVEAQVAETIAKIASTREQALAWKEVLHSSSDTDDMDSTHSLQSASYVLHLSDNKTGPDGHKLFGGIGVKKLYQELMTDLESKFPTNKNDSNDDEKNNKNNNKLDINFLRNSKQVKIGDIIDDETKEVLVGDIKHVGTFRMKVVLLNPNNSGSSVKNKKGRPKPINAIPTTSDDDDEEIVATVRVVVEGSKN
jgi:ribosomal protein L9